ncbi:hypothetical protein DXA30_02565 [Fusobacterium ulcerans]|jgi:hypothetical protein|uniref:phage antirepressor N-terminal domain-containing protein n=1 Tax=Fusobacterium ulcerans TaxID=861 RepID=UPI000E4C74CD|nr:phage antirepressor N-terminal domain-containing protein [Fusobacterium ulcerans]RGY66655.1 hypothetical protein DXA30_02565 [Fusobacterium ulcerans]
MKNLIIKEVEFQSNKLTAISENGKIYVSVSSVCDNLGMSKNLKDAQVKKIQNEELLKGASKLTHLKTNGGIQETLVIELDYLPAWLFKINPARFDEKLKEKLMIYQLKAKDILADAFFGKREKEIPLLPEDKDWALKRINDRLNQAKELEEEIYPVIKFLEKIYEEIEGIAKIKREATFREFKNFKTPEKYDASKEKLPILQK